MKRLSLTHVLYLLVALSLLLSQTAFGTLSAGVFDSPIPLPTPTVTPGPTPTATPVPVRDATGISMQTRLTPAMIGPGWIATVVWEIANDTDSEVRDLQLTSQLPRGLRVLPKTLQRPLTYNSARHTLSASIARVMPRTAISLQVKLNTAGMHASEGATFASQLRQGSTTIADVGTTLTIGEVAPEIATLSPDGGDITLEGGRVRLTFPTGAITRTMTVRGRLLPRPSDAPGNMIRAFEFEVAHAAGNAQHGFDRPLTLSIHDPEHLTGSERIVLQSDETGDWEALPTSWDESSKTLSANVPHLSLLGLTSDHMALSLPSISGIQTDLFTGSASVEYPIPVPPGAGGLAPSVSLQFNSRSRAEDPGNSSIMGNGWRLSQDNYGAWTPWLMGTPGRAWRVNGVSYNEGNGSLQQAPDWRLIDRGEYVDIYSPDGTKYRFAQALHDFWCNSTEGSPKNWRAVTWALKTVTDSMGNTINYEYDNPLPVTHGDDLNNVNLIDGLGRDFDTWATCAKGTTRYLSQINLQRIVYNGGRTIVEFEYAKNGSSTNYREDGPFTIDDADSNGENYKYWVFFSTRLLKAIRVKQDDKYIAGYDIGYDERVSYDQAGRWYPSASRYQVKGIQQMKIDENTGLFLTDPVYHDG